MTDNTENPNTGEIKEEQSFQLIESESKVYKPANSEIDKMMAQVLNLNDKRIYHEPTCPICNSPYRDDFEKAWDKKKNHDDARSILKLDIGNAVIDNHMSNHHARSVKEIQKLEYSSKIARINKANPSTLDKLQLCSSMILERIVEVNSISPNNNSSIIDIEKIKSSETARLGGVLNQLMKLQAGIMGEMKSSGELITIPSDEFVRVFNDTITSAKTDGERQIVKSILDRLQRVNKGN